MYSRGRFFYEWKDRLYILRTQRKGSGQRGRRQKTRQDKRYGFFHKRERHGDNSSRRKKFFKNIAGAENIFIPWKCILKIGSDVILVDLNNNLTGMPFNGPNVNPRECISPAG